MIIITAARGVLTAGLTLGTRARIFCVDTGLRLIITFGGVAAIACAGATG